MEGVNKLIREILDDGTQVELQEIYKLIIEKNNLSYDNREMIRDLKHQIRSALWGLIRSSKVIRISKGKYKKI